MKEQVIYQDKICDYNLTKPSETDKRKKLLDWRRCDHYARGDHR